METQAEEVVDIIEKAGSPEIWDRSLSMVVNAWISADVEIEANEIAERIERVFSGNLYLDALLDRALELTSTTIEYAAGDVPVIVLGIIYTIAYSTPANDPTTIVF